MLTLGSSNITVKNVAEGTGPFVIRLCDDASLPLPLRESEAYIIQPNQPIPEGFALYIFLEEESGRLDEISHKAPVMVLPNAYDYLASGDVIRLNLKNNSIRVLYRRNSNHNSFLTTERCNNYCLMCSQPPKTADDSWIVDEILATIPLISRETQEIGFTGGEPTILGDDFIKILETCKNWLPNTSIHILSNGRNFANPEFASKYAAINHHDMMVGIPLYSDISNIHDYVVQADGAYDETIRGILNLKRLGQKVEIRVVIHKQTYERLPQLAEFLARNLLFVDHIALMGLEMMGFTKANLEELWIDPADYQLQLQKAVDILANYRMNVSIYNHQLCLLDRSLWPFARKSISDWKNEYMDECTGCGEMDACGGFFSSALLRYSDHIKPIGANA